jgi:hypothetical protein
MTQPQPEETPNFHREGEKWQGVGGARRSPFPHDMTSLPIYPHAPSSTANRAPGRGLPTRQSTARTHPGRSRGHRCDGRAGPGTGCTHLRRDRARYVATGSTISGVTTPPGDPPPPELATASLRLRSARFHTQSVRITHDPPAPRSAPPRYIKQPVASTCEPGSSASNRLPQTTHCSLQRNVMVDPLADRCHAIGDRFDQRLTVCTTFRSGTTAREPSGFPDTPDTRKGHSTHFAERRNSANS